MTLVEKLTEQELHDYIQEFIAKAISYSIDDIVDFFSQRRTMPTFKLLSSLNSNTKLEKSNLIQDTYLNVNMYIEPRNRLICPFQDEAGCKEPCLNTAGLGGV